MHINVALVIYLLIFSSTHIFNLILHYNIFTFSVFKTDLFVAKIKKSNIIFIFIIFQYNLHI